MSDIADIEIDVDAHLWLQYVCIDDIASIMPSAVNKYYQGAEECFYVQSILELLFFF